uniref:Uncharacterized protein n=1 Tax=uncultured Thiotrichaceae bacterium TaxID=298394 RepID=A0A6S6ULF9_9GAMM|nr:MAG: Unknown protein [uncultured Thiotrichaceae bacterium]
MTIHFKNLPRSSTAALLVLSALNTAVAGEVTIVDAEFTNTGEREWSVNVTLEHADSGWDHYADNWRVVDAEDNVLGDRVLYHPHVEEQPFTRSLSGVEIPEGVTEVFITAHDKVHGWTEDRLLIDLEKAEDGVLKVLGEVAE